MNHHSLRDFGRARSSLAVDVPDRLIHYDVDRRTSERNVDADRRPTVSVVDLPAKTLSMTVGGLEPGQTTSKHRHTYETILYVVEGEGFSVIEGRRVEWKAGDAVYVPAWAWHQHTNVSTEDRCRYIACENAPLMQSLNAALREEAP